MTKISKKSQTTVAKHILIANGVNLDLLGRREPSIYGLESLVDLDHRLRALQSSLTFQYELFQSNDEAAYLEKIARPGYDCLILNPGAWTHTSLALRDRLLAIKAQFIEVHLSNIWAREAIRHNSLISELAIGVISGLGMQGYELAVRALVNR